MEHEWEIVLDGASNVRDLGSFASPCRPPAMRRLVRSANLDRLSEQGLAAFAELRMAVVIDLRGRQECAAAPRLEGTRRVHLPIEPTVVAELLAHRAAGSLSVDCAVAVMKKTYCCYITEHAAVFAELLHHVLAARRHPVLFHCAAGKDRTGIAAALILTALGVAPELIMQDYLLSNSLYRPPAPVAADIPDDVREAILRVRPCYLEAAFEAMNAGWGGPGRYLEQALGFGARERQALREAMT